MQKKKKKVTSTACLSQWWRSSSQRFRSGQRAHPPGPGEVYGEGGVPGRVPFAWPEHPWLQTQGRRRGEVWGRAAESGRADQTSRGELWAEEADGGWLEGRKWRRGEHAQVNRKYTNKLLLLQGLHLVVAWGGLVAQFLLFSALIRTYWEETRRGEYFKKLFVNRRRQK